VSPDEALAEAKAGKLRPIYLVAGEEAHLVDQTVRALRESALSGGIVGLNDDSFHASNANFAEVMAVARTLPMLSSRRWVLVRDMEKWDSAKKDKGDTRSSPLDALVEYAEHAPSTTVLVLVAGKLDKRKRLYVAAKKDGWLVSCETPARNELPGWIVERVQARGNSIGRGTADLLAELLGPELGPVAEAVERLCLYAGSGQTITEEAVSECVVRLRTASVWQLLDAVGRRDIGSALRMFDDVFDPQDRGLPLIGTFSWAMRQLIKFDAARKRGMNSADAAKAAGAPPFKARDLENQLRGLSAHALPDWLEQVAAADLALKGGSRRPARATLEQMIIDLCRAG